LTLLTSIVATIFVRAMAKRFDILDKPEEDRKKHQYPTPLLGGVAVIFAVAVGLVFAWSSLIGGYLLPKHLVGFLAAAMVLLV